MAQPRTMGCRRGYQPSAWGPTEFPCSGGSPRCSTHVEYKVSQSRALTQELGQARARPLAAELLAGLEMSREAA
eukprot:scaffold22545_cov72-Phaeocystis_antarctica.AAC.2